MVWGMCKEMLDTPHMITQLGIDHYERLIDLDANQAHEIQKLQTAMAEQEAAKQWVIGLVARGKIGEGDADAELDSINAETNHWLQHAPFVSIDRIEVRSDHAS
jgi:hypothetical protein